MVNHYNRVAEKTAQYRFMLDAHWERNPMAYRIESFVVDSRTVLRLARAAGRRSV